MIYYMFRERTRRVRMTHKVGKMENLWGVSFFFSHMREMSNVNYRMVLGIQD